MERLLGIRETCDIPEFCSSTERSSDSRCMRSGHDARERCSSLQMLFHGCNNNMDPAKRIRELKNDKSVELTVVDDRSVAIPDTPKRASSRSIQIQIIL